MVLVTPRHRPITPKGLAQKHYIEAIRTHDLTFGIGPAGTGKTYLAMAMAVNGLVTRASSASSSRGRRSRPARSSGFLPGDLAEKVNPYLRPLYDALHDMMDIDRAEGLIARGQIEVAPLAFMRGRTLNDCFVILDEAQNATSEQMRMFLTRLGYASKAVVTGDVTQVDLPHGAPSGLAEAQALLSGIEGIAFCTLHRGGRGAPPARAEDHRRLRAARRRERSATSEAQRQPATRRARSAEASRAWPPRPIGRASRPRFDSVDAAASARVAAPRRRACARSARADRTPTRSTRHAPAPAALHGAPRDAHRARSPRPRCGTAGARCFARSRRSSPRATRCSILLGRPARSRPRAGAEPRARRRSSRQTRRADELFVALHNAFELMESRRAPRAAASG